MELTTTSFEDIESVTVKIEPDSLYLPHDETETKTDMKPMSIVHNQKNEDEKIPSLMCGDVKIKYETDDSHSEEKGKIVEFLTSTKEEMYNSEEYQISQWTNVTNVECTTSEYRGEEEENWMCDSDNRLDWESQNMMHSVFLEYDTPGTSTKKSRISKGKHKSSVLPVVKSKQNKKNLEENLENKNYVCAVCSKLFTCKSHLKRHINDVHQMLKSCECKICKKKFSNNYLVRKHYNAVHKKLKSYECQACSKKFSYSNLLKEHVSVIHKGIKDYECDECGKKFCRLQVLKLHINRVHAGTKDHKCEQCNKSYSQLHHLKIHILTVHMKLKIYQCEYCNKGYSGSSSLKNHIRKNHALV